MSNELLSLVAGGGVVAFMALACMVVWALGVRFAGRSGTDVREQLGTAQKDIIALRGRYNAELAQQGVMQVEIGQMRAALVQQREMIAAHYRAIVARDTYISEILAQLAAVGYQGLPALPPTRPPPVPAPRPAPHYIDPRALRDLADILAPLMGSREARDSYLLAGLSPKFTNKITRSPETQADLINIVTMAHSWGAETFRMLLQNAAAALNGSEAGQALTDWCSTWNYTPLVAPVA